MAKDLQSNYMKFPRLFWLKRDSDTGKYYAQQKGYKLSVNAKWLFVTLKELENAYTNRKNQSNYRIYFEGMDNVKKYFYQSNEDLAEESGLSVSSVKRAKQELVRSGLLEIRKAHFINQYDERSTFAISVYIIHDDVYLGDLFDEPYTSPSKKKNV